MTKKPKPAEPATWAQTILGAMAVWAMMALGYGTIPHEWLTFGNSYLNFNTATFLMQQEPVHPFRHHEIGRDRRGAHAPTCPMMSFIGRMTSAAPTAQPTRRPVAANAFEIASTMTTYGAISGRSVMGSTCLRPAP